MAKTNMSNNISEDIKIFLEKGSTQIFLKAAQNFVSLLENEEISFQDFMNYAHSSLLELYISGYHLEDISLKYSDADKEINNNINIESKNRNLISNLKKEILYWEVFDPTDSREEDKTVLASLEDDFGDIYKDLKRELEKIKLNSDEAIEDALWQLNFGFKYHWGNHCIDAMRALHYLWYEGKK
ncbi:MAG: DUF5063 domain-containing protein [Ignavibacteriae bacterium]|nr:DUF5063 domain-containing protein [Ignavibacteriota bacterium]